MVHRILKRHFYLAYTLIYKSGNLSYLLYNPTKDTYVVEPCDVPYYPQLPRRAASIVPGKAKGKIIRLCHVYINSLLYVQLCRLLFQQFVLPSVMVLLRMSQDSSSSSSNLTSPHYRADRYLTPPKNIF